MSKAATESDVLVDVEVGTAAKAAPGKSKVAGAVGKVTGAVTGAVGALVTPWTDWRTSKLGLKLDRSPKDEFFAWDLWRGVIGEFST
jgi:hypothetical protein